MTRIGILSDTHLSSPTPWFIRQVTHAFSECTIILHAGDLTDLSVLSVFEDKKIHAVHGNMCDYSSNNVLPHHCSIEIDGIHIGLCHGAGSRHNIEDRMWELFPTADCIVYGHTHMTVNHKVANTLFINPGSFSSTGRHGASGSYAILDIEGDHFQANLHQLNGAGR